MMIIRISKILLVASISFYCLLTAFSNMNDYATNFLAIQHVFMMDNLLPHTTLTSRAITSPLLHHAGFITILTLETLTGILCGLGAFKLFRARKNDATTFNQAKATAIIGLTLGFLTWQVIFMSIGGEWFGMWMNPMFNNALTTAFHIFITILVTLLYLVHYDQ